jgi:hypothetical protein
MVEITRKMHECSEEFSKMTKYQIAMFLCLGGLMACTVNAAKDTHDNVIVFKNNKYKRQIIWSIDKCVLSESSSDQRVTALLSTISNSEKFKKINGSPNSFAMPLSLPKRNDEWVHEDFSFKVVGERTVKVQKVEYPVLIIERKSIDNSVDDSIRFLYNTDHGILGFDFSNGTTSLVQKIPADIFLNCQQKPSE